MHLLTVKKKFNIAFIKHYVIRTLSNTPIPHAIQFQIMQYNIGINLFFKSIFCIIRLWRTFEFQISISKVQILI